MLRGEFLEASQSPAAAKRAFCDSYRAHGLAAASGFAQAFMSDAVAALAAPADGGGVAGGHGAAARLRSYSLAVEYLEMAFCIAPDTPELEEGLAEVRRARDGMAAAAAVHRDEL